MTFVLDASVAIQWVLSEPDSSKAISLRDDFRNQVHNLIAPETFLVEVAHALTRRSVEDCLSSVR
jgi:predicted nucleic acid-binding protein